MTEVASPAAPSSPRLEVRGLGKAYSSPSGELVVLRDVELTLAGGEGAVIIGPSGSGKSTLLHMIGGLDTPTAGRVLVDGEDPHAMDAVGLARFRNETVGFVFQDHYLLPQCTALENVLLPALARRGANAERVERAKLLLDRVGLAHRMTHRPAEMSGGERQRAALARALLMEPALLLCDEPTGNLDQTAARNVADLLFELHQRTNAALLIVTHSMELANRAPRRMRLDDGRLEPAP